jgi:hypothetical protein
MRPDRSATRQSPVHVLALGAAVAFWCAAGIVLPAQQPAVTITRSVASVRSLPTFGDAAVSAAQTELTIAWAALAGTPDTIAPPDSLPELHQFQLQRRVAVSDPPVRERDPQISSDELVIVAHDAQQREIGWQHVKDPRLVRSEQPGPTGVLSGQEFQRVNVDLVVRVPDDLLTVSLAVYEVRRSDAGLILRQLGTIPLR